MSRSALLGQRASRFPRLLVFPNKPTYPLPYCAFASLYCAAHRRSVLAGTETQRLVPLQVTLYKLEALIRDDQVLLAGRCERTGCLPATEGLAPCRYTAILHQRLKDFERYFRQRSLFLHAG